MGDDSTHVRKAGVRLLAGLLLVALVAACGSDDSETDAAQETTTTQAEEPTETTNGAEDDTAECADLGASVKLAIPSPQDSFAPPIIAKESGIYDDYGLDVEILNMAAPNMPPALVGGDIQFAAPVSTVNKAALQGIPVKGVFVTVTSPANVIVAKSSLQSPDDLQGKRLVTGPLPSGPGITAAWAVEALGFEVGKDVELVPVADPAARHGLVVEGQADAVLMGLDAAFRALRDNPDLHILVPREDVPSYGGTGLGVSEAYLEENEDVVECMVRASAATLRLIEDDAEQTTELIGEILGLDEDEASQIYDYYLDAKTDDGIPDDEFLQREVRAAIRSGVPDATMDQLKATLDLSIAERVAAG